MVFSQAFSVSLTLSHTLYVFGGLFCVLLKLKENDSRLPSGWFQTTRVVLLLKSPNFEHGREGGNIGRDFHGFGSFWGECGGTKIFLTDLVRPFWMSGHFLGSTPEIHSSSPVLFYSLTFLVFSFFYSNLIPNLCYSKKLNKYWAVAVVQLTERPM